MAKASAKETVLMEPDGDGMVWARASFLLSWIVEANVALREGPSNSAGHDVVL